MEKLPQLSPGPVPLSAATHSTDCPPRLAAVAPAGTAGGRLRGAPLAPCRAPGPAAAARFKGEAAPSGYRCCVGIQTASAVFAEDRTAPSFSRSQSPRATARREPLSYPHSFTRAARVFKQTRPVAASTARPAQRGRPRRENRSDVPAAHCNPRSRKLYQQLCGSIPDTR